MVKTKTLIGQQTVTTWEHFLGEWDRHKKERGNHLKESEVFCLSFMLAHPEFVGKQVTLEEAQEFYERNKRKPYD